MASVAAPVAAPVLVNAPPREEQKAQEQQRVPSSVVSTAALTHQIVYAQQFQAGQVLDHYDHTHQSVQDTVATLLGQGTWAWINQTHEGIKRFHNDHPYLGLILGIITLCLGLQQFLPTVFSALVIAIPCWGYDYLLFQEVSNNPQAFLRNLHIDAASGLQFNRISHAEHARAQAAQSHPNPSAGMQAVGNYPAISDGRVVPHYNHKSDAVAQQLQQLKEAGKLAWLNRTKEGLQRFIRENPVLALVMGIITAIYSLQQILPSAIYAVIVGAPCLYNAFVAFQNVYKNPQNLQHDIESGFQARVILHAEAALARRGT